MGAINNAFLKGAAGLAAGAKAVSNIQDTQAALKKEDINLAEEALDIKGQKAEIESDENYQLLQLVEKQGKTDKDKAVAAKELEKYREALNILELKQKANDVQRNVWKKRYARFFPKYFGGNE